jgi:hypothetical protein
VLSGMPTEPGSFPLTIAATDAAGCGATQSFNLAVNAGAGFQATALAINSSANPSAFNAPVALTATLTGGLGTPGGSVTFFDGATQLGSPATVSGRAASTNAVFNTVGAHSLSILYSGDAIFGGGRAALTQTVNPAATSVALTSSNASGVELGQPVTFTAAVTSLAGIPGGSVEFLDGTASLGIVALDGSDSASVTTSSLGAGSHTISVSLPASANFAAATATFTQTVLQPQVAPAASFIVAAVATTASMSTNTPAIYPLTITVNGTLGAPISFACAGLPAGDTCTFTPASVTASTTVTLTVSNGALSRRSPAGGSPLAAAALLPGLLLGGLFAKRRFKPGMLACLALATFAFGSTSCVKGASESTTVQFTVVATSGSAQQTTSLQLLVGQ